MLTRVFLSFILLLGFPLTAMTQTVDNRDIYKEIALSEFEFLKARNYCQRLYGYYRYIDDGKAYVHDKELRLYRVFEGIFELDVRYSRNEDDGATVIAGINLIHPDKPGRFVEFYELKPYSFLEYARKSPKLFNMETRGDTTRIYGKRGLAGIAVIDTLQKELRIDYNALAPDTAKNINLLILKAHLSRVNAKAVYRIDDTDAGYIPQEC